MFACKDCSGLWIVCAGVGGWGRRRRVGARARVRLISSLFLLTVIIGFGLMGFSWMILCL